MMYPLFANLRGCTVLVVGGGAVAARKVATLLDAGASVRVGAPVLTASLARLVQDGCVEHLPGSFQPAWLDGAWLAIAATGDCAVNARVARHAEARRIFVNVVDDAKLSRFHAPARLQRGPLNVAISSGGSAPALARRTRAHLETVLDSSLGPLAELVSRHRARIREAFPEITARNHFYDDLVDGPVATLLRQARTEAAEQALLQQLAAPKQPVAGNVALVGAGPGDPDLLTIKALRALQRADVIVHDRLVDAGILELARRDALRVDVGKRRGGDHEATQHYIHQMLLEHARAGRRVVRLKGGDPLVFGRGGEELEFLRAHGVNYEVIPGITAAVACAAHAGVPLTHRDHASCLHITTTHRTHALSAQEWRELARERQTLAIYMAASQLDTLPRQLIVHGRASGTPFVLVENGTRSDQRVVAGRLDQLSRLAAQHQVHAPALLIIGEVAALASQLSWFGDAVLGDQALPPAA